MRRTIVLGWCALFAVAAGCGGSSPGGTGGAGGASAGGRGGTSSAGTGGATTGGTGGASTGGTGGAATGGTGGASTGGTGGAATGGAGGSGTGGTGGAPTGGTGGTSTGGTGGAGVGGRGGTGGGGGTGGSGGPRTVTLVSADGLAFTAGQDGDGAWRALNPLPALNMYTLEVTGARYGLAYGCATAAGDSMTITMTVIQATVAETTRVAVVCGGLSTAAPVTITGTVGGLADAQPARIDIAGFGQQVTGSATGTAPTYSLSVPSGTWDLFARRMNTPPVFDRLIRRTSVILTGPTTVNLDFASEGFAPEMRTVTFQGLSATETAGLIVIFRNTAGGSQFGLGSFPSGNYLAFPAAQLRTGDYHSVVAAASEPGGNVGRRVRRTYTAAMSFTAVMPPMITPPVIAVGATTPYVRPRGTIPAGLDSDRYDLGYNQGDISLTRSRIWALQLTRGWITAAGASDYTLPDLSAVTGFQAWWGLTAGEATYQQFANWSNGGVADLLRVDQTAAEMDGREQKITQRTGLVTF